jgi:hypothetical protein
MKLIAHRGNICGPNPLNENNPQYIDDAIKLCYDVEVDVWFKNDKIYLGHDQPQYCVSMNWLYSKKNKLWIHCKNLKSLEFFINNTEDFNYFWHQEDYYTLTSKNYIWTYPGNSLVKKSIIVMPEWNISLENFLDIKKYDCYGVCSDYVQKLL